MDLGSNIRYLRKQAHLSQEGLAKLAGINVSAIRGYEAGKYKPKKENLEKICHALNCNIDDIMDDSSLSSSGNCEDCNSNFDIQYFKIVDKLKKGKPLYSPELYFLCTNYIQKIYLNLNEKETQKAGEQILDFLEELNELSQDPDYQERQLQ